MKQVTVAVFIKLPFGPLCAHESSALHSCITARCKSTECLATLSRHTHQHNFLTSLPNNSAFGGSGYSPLLLTFMKLGQLQCMFECFICVILIYGCVASPSLYSNFILCLKTQISSYFMPLPCPLCWLKLMKWKTSIKIRSLQ